MTEAIDPDRPKETKEIEPPFWIAFPLGLAIIWVIVHVIRNRTATDILTYSMSTAAATLVALVLLLVYLLLNERPRVSLAGYPLAGAIAVVFSLVIFSTMYGLLLYAVGASLKDLYLWFQAGLGELRGTRSWSAAPPDVLGMVVVLVTVLPLIAGVLLFYFRKSFRSLYGITEAVVGVLVAIDRVFGSPPDRLAINSDFMLVMLTASVFLVIQGLDNVHKGFGDPSKDLLAAKVLTWISNKPDTPITSRS